MIDSVYEPIEHDRHMPAKVFLTGMDRSRYHWHNDYEMVLVLKGRLTLFRGPQPVTLRAGDILLVNSKTVHGFRGEGNNICLFLQFSPSFFAPALGPGQTYHFHFNSAGPGMAPKIGYAPFVRLAAAVGTAAQTPGYGGRLRTCARLELLLAELLDAAQYDIRRGPLTREVPPDGHLAAKIGAYIHDHCEQRDLVQHLCSHFAVGEKSLYRYVKTALGMSPRQMIDQERTERAKERLRCSGVPVAMVGEECGFSSEVTFHRVFKRETGLTPGAYRQKESLSLVGKEIRGYASFDRKEARMLLEQFTVC